MVNYLYSIKALDGRPIEGLTQSTKWDEIDAALERLEARGRRVTVKQIEIHPTERRRT